MMKLKSDMVLCYKCSDAKHEECMGKLGMIDCNCELCKSEYVKS